jgi:hypothetical protein
MDLKDKVVLITGAGRDGSVWHFRKEAGKWSNDVNRQSLVKIGKQFEAKGWSFTRKSRYFY